MRLQFFYKTNLFEEWMKKFVPLLTKEKGLRMNGKMMTLTFFKPYKVCLKNQGNCFPYLLVNLFKERYISSAKSYKNLNKLIS